jgi:hypothetical protein
MVWGTFSYTGAFTESVGNMLNYPLQFYYQLVVLPHRISLKLKVESIMRLLSV